MLPLRRGDLVYDLSAVDTQGIAYDDATSLPLTPALSAKELQECFEFTRDYLAAKRLPDQRRLMVMPLFWGYANLGISPKPPLENAGVFYDSWQFPTHEAALHAFRTWNPEESPEPEGWDRHVNSGRRRPGGDKSKEYVKEW